MLKITSGRQYIILDVLVSGGILTQIFFYGLSIYSHFLLSIFKVVGYSFILKEGREILVETIVSTA